ncbi:MAG: Pr6Pr family membrane protein [Steroidobacteraceae bacterium]
MSARSTGIALSVAAWCGLALQLALSIRLTYRSGNPSLSDALITYFGYFTILTNLFVALVATAGLAEGRGAWAKTLAKRTWAGCATTSIVFVCASYHFLLREIWSPQGLQWLADIDLHYAVPVLALLHWTVSRGPRLAASAPLIWCIYPAAYFAYALIRGAWLQTYPYPFIDVSVLGYPRVAIHSLILLAAYVLFGYFVWGIGRVRGRSSTQPLTPVS